MDTVGVTALPSEDSVSERRRKLEFLEMQEELIKVDFVILCLFEHFSILLSREIPIHRVVIAVVVIVGGSFYIFTLMIFFELNIDRYM